MCSWQINDDDDDILRSLTRIRLFRVRLNVVRTQTAFNTYVVHWIQHSRYILGNVSVKHGANVVAMVDCTQNHEHCTGCRNKKTLLRKMHIVVVVLNIPAKFSCSVP